MLVSAILAALALALVVTAPALLALRPWQLRHPRLALTIWYSAFALGVLLAVGAIACTIVLAATARSQAAVAETAALSIAGWLLLGAVGAVVGFILTAATSASGPGFRGDVAVAREDRDGFTLVRFDDATPHAYSVPGSRPEIFYSSGMRDALSEAEFMAVIAHEYAHLRQHHGTALRIADLNAACVPLLPAGRALKRATRLLMELAADDAAARQVGPAHLANALTRLAVQSGDPALTLRAERVSDKRWPAPRRRRLPHALRPLATGLALAE